MTLPANTGKLWSIMDENKLIYLIEDYISLDEICRTLKRTENGITARAAKCFSKGMIEQKAYKAFLCSIEYNINAVVTDCYDDPKIKEPKMNENLTWTMVSLLQEDYTTVAVVFSTSDTKLEHLRQYTYKTKFQVYVDDIVIVEKDDSYKAVKVVAVHDTPQIDIDSAIKYKWLVGKVDVTEYKQLVELDNKAYAILVEAEKHARRKKVMDLYKEVLKIEDLKDLKTLISTDNSMDKV